MNEKAIEKAEGRTFQGELQKNSKGSEAGTYWHVEGRPGGQCGGKVMCEGR